MHFGALACRGRLCFKLPSTRFARLSWGGLQGLCSPVMHRQMHVSCFGYSGEAAEAIDDRPGLFGQIGLGRRANRFQPGAVDQFEPEVWPMVFDFDRGGGYERHLVLGGPAALIDCVLFTVAVVVEWHLGTLGTGAVLLGHDTVDLGV